MRCGQTERKSWLEIEIKILNICIIYKQIVCSVLTTDIYMSQSLAVSLRQHGFLGPVTYDVSYFSAWILVFAFELFSKFGA